MKKIKVLNNIPILMLVIIIAKLVGMFRDVVLANYFGTSNVSDAYLIALSIPTFLFWFIGHSLTTAYIPMYNKIKQAHGDTGAVLYTNNIITISLLLCVVIVAVLLAFPQIFVKLFAAGFDEETTQLTAGFIRICAPGIFLMTLINIFGGYLQANSSFLAPAAVSLPRNIVFIISIIIAASYGKDMLGWGLLGAYVAELLLLLPFTIAKRFIYHPVIRYRDDYLKETFYIVIPILLGMCVSQINKIIDRSMASMVVQGGLSALTYASIINNAVQEILVTGIITVLFASCSKLVAYGAHEAVKKKLSNTIDMMILLLIPASMGIIILARPIVSVVLCRGSFDAWSLEATSGALLCYTIGLPFLAIRDTLVKVFYAYKDTKTTTITAIISILINIVLNLALYKVIGLNGLAIATSISAVFHCTVLYNRLHKKIGDFGTRATLQVVLKSTIAGIIMAVSLFFVWDALNRVIAQGILSLALSILTGMAVYLVCNLILKNAPLINMLKRKSQKHTKVENIA